ncbi:hypothetical protein ACFQX4_23485, partial [Roseomonas sp. GCM10028921]
MTHNENAATSGDTTNQPSGAEPGSAADIAAAATAAPGEATGASPPARGTGERWRDPLVVVGASWLRGFTPRPESGEHGGETPAVLDDAQPGQSY